MRRLLLACVPALLLSLIPAEAPGQRRGRRAKKRGTTVHLVYAWQERVDAIPIEHEIHLYGNGFMRYAQRTSGVAAQESTLPNDQAFVDEVVKQVRLLKRSKAFLPPCGAPQGGRLTVRMTGHRRRAIDLSKRDNWNRYGRLMRRILNRVTGREPTSLEADCQPLQLRVDPHRLTRPPKVRPLTPATQQRELLLRYGQATDAAARASGLAALARTRDGDRFFRWALLRRHPLSLVTRRLVRRHASELVRGVRTPAEARLLLRALAQLQGPEGHFQRSLLLLMLGRSKEAGSELPRFFQALNQLGTERQSKKELDRFGQAQVDRRRRRPPWGRVRRATATLFGFWLDLAQRVWGGDPEAAPPLAIWLFRRALHFGRLSSLAPNIRATGGGPKRVRAARRLVVSHYPRLARGRWDRLTISARQDLLAVVGHLRRRKERLDPEWVKAHLDSPAQVVCRMVRMHYFGVAERFVERILREQKLPEGPLRVAQGRCLTELERWGQARDVLTLALGMEAPGARLARVASQLELGDLDGAERDLNLVPEMGAEGLLLSSRLWRLRNDPGQAHRAARLALGAGAGARARLAMGRALLVAAEGERARKAFAAGADEDSDAGREARLALGRLALAGGEAKAAMDAVWPLIVGAEGKGGRTIVAAAHAVLAVAAHQLRLPPLAELQLERARYHAHTDPAALAALAEVLVNGSYGLATAVTALRDAQGLRPRWSRLFALQAFVYAQLRQRDRAEQAIGAALLRRPDFPPYRALARAIARLAEVQL